MTGGKHVEWGRLKKLSAKDFKEFGIWARNPDWAKGGLLKQPRGDLAPGGLQNIENNSPAVVE